MRATKLMDLIKADLVIAGDSSGLVAVHALSSWVLVFFGRDRGLERAVTLPCRFDGILGGDDFADDGLGLFNISHRFSITISTMTCASSILRQSYSVAIPYRLGWIKSGVFPFSTGFIGSGTGANRDTCGLNGRE